MSKTKYDNYSNLTYKNLILSRKLLNYIIFKKQQMLQAHGQNGNVVKTYPSLINEEFGEIIGVEINGKPYIVC